MPLYANLGRNRQILGKVIAGKSGNPDRYTHPESKVEDGEGRPASEAGAKDKEAD